APWWCVTSARAMRARVMSRMVIGVLLRGAGVGAPSRRGRLLVATVGADGRVRRPHRAVAVLERIAVTEVGQVGTAEAVGALDGGVNGSHPLLEGRVGRLHGPVSFGGAGAGAA